MSGALCQARGLFRESLVFVFLRNRVRDNSCSNRNSNRSSGSRTTRSSSNSNGRTGSGSSSGSSSSSNSSSSSSEGRKANRANNNNSGRHRREGNVANFRNPAKYWATTPPHTLRLQRTSQSRKIGSGERGVGAKRAHAWQWPARKPDAARGARRGPEKRQVQSCLDPAEKRYRFRGNGSQHKAGSGGGGGGSSSSSGGSSGASSGRSGRNFLRNNSNRRRIRNRYDGVLQKRYRGAGLREGEGKSN